MTGEEIRKDWKGALDTMEYLEISEAITWGFSGYDLMILAALHEFGDAATRQKIADLLEDCNFHTFNGLIYRGDYAGARKYGIVSL